MSDTTSPEFPEVSAAERLAQTLAEEGALVALQAEGEKAYRLAARDAIIGLRPVPVRPAELDALASRLSAIADAIEVMRTQVAEEDSLRKMEALKPIVARADAIRRQVSDAQSVVDSLLIEAMRLGAQAGFGPNQVRDRISVMLARGLGQTPDATMRRRYLDERAAAMRYPQGDHLVPQTEWLWGYAQPDHQAAIRDAVQGILSPPAPQAAPVAVAPEAEAPAAPEAHPASTEPPASPEAETDAPASGGE